MIQGIQLCFSISTQRIELFAIWPKRLNIFSDSKNWNFFSMTCRIEPFKKILLTEVNIFFKTTHRIEHFFFEYDSQKWPYFLNMTQRFEHLIFLNMTQWIEPFDFWKWLTELNFFFQFRLTELIPFKYDSKILFLKNDFKKLILLNMTQRIEPF